MGQFLSDPMNRSFWAYEPVFSFRGIFTIPATANFVEQVLDSARVLCSAQAFFVFEDTRIPEGLYPAAKILARRAKSLDFSVSLRKPSIPDCLRHRLHRFEDTSTTVGVTSYRNDANRRKLMAIGLA
jgi:hypothetical protein